MRKFLFLTFFGFFLSLAGFAQTWTRMQSWGLDFESINWINENLGFIVGERIILRSTNGGISWEEIPFTFEGKLRDVDFLNATTGVAVGENGMIYFSQNGGDSWTKAISNTSARLNSVSFFSESRLFVVGDSGILLSSLNSGETWSTINSGTTESLNDLYFTSSDSAFIAGDQGRILRTSNAGNSWTTLNSGQTVDLKGISFSNSKTGYAAGELGTVLKTIDGGVNWSKLNSTVSTTLRKVAISTLDARIINIVGESATAIRSTNSGTSFSKINLGTTTPGALTDLAFKPTTTQVFAVGPAGNLISSTNSGSSYSQRLLGIRNNLTATDFKTDRFGFISGERGELFVTSNSALTLIRRPIPEPIKIVSIDFWNTGFGYVSGESGKMYRTANTGTSWVAVPAQTSQTINGFYLFAPSVAYIVGNNGYIARSFDSGVTWNSSVQTNSSENLRDVTFFDFQVGFAMGDNGQISWSNGGNIWENLPKLTAENLNALAKVDSATAIIVGNKGVILKSEDKGRTWRRIETTETENLNSVDFWDASVGFIVGDKGKTLVTNNGGETWGEVPSGTLRNLTSVSAGNPTVAYAVGDDGTILNYVCVPPSDLSEISGPQTSCLNVQKYNIQDNPAPGSSIVWRVEGGQIQSGQGTEEIEVLWTSIGDNGVFVSRENFCGAGETSFISVGVNQIPPINQISGEGKACIGPTYSYSLPEISAVTYTWSIAGGEIISGQGKSKIEVKWTSSGVQQLGVIQENTCGKSALIVQPINITSAPAQPGTIQGSAIVGLGIQTYEIPIQPEVNFQWEISGGGVIQQGQGSNRVEVNWLTEGIQTLKVTPQNECNNGPAQTLAVNVNIITSLPEQLETGVKIYPNPSDGRVYLELKDATIWESVQLINSFGQVVSRVELGRTQERIKFENLGKGLFIIQLQNKNELRQYKVIVNQ